MIKPPTKILIGSLLTFLVLVGVFLGLQYSESEPDKPNSVNTAQPDASEKTIDQAIQQKDPSVCEGVETTTRPGPNDGPIKLTGDEAVEWCKEQVEAGQRIYGG
jgi:hypothetical protein